MNRLSTILILCAPLLLSAQLPAPSGEFVPPWAKEAIWYQIFPERFRNGDPGNDPTLSSLKGADPQEMPKAWEISPWGSDWYKLQPWELQNGEPEMWKHLLRRRYGGDLQGIIDKLDYLQNLGVTALYLNPVFEAPSLHKYDGATFHHIDPHFGPDPEGDRARMATEDPLDPTTWVWTQADELALDLIRQCHARGIRIIFDGVFNHMGLNSFAFQDVLTHQQRSRYRDWFIINSWDDPTAGTRFSYQGWFGASSLPELAEDDQGIVAGPRDYIFAATDRWMNPKGLGPEAGIDGWRLDVAYCIGHPFWKTWRRYVRELNPEAYLTAEIVNKPEVVIPYMQGDEFDGEMNYNFAFTCAEFFLYPPDMRIQADEFDRRLQELRDLYPPGVAYASMNLFGSHDVNRIASCIVNAGIGSWRDWGTYFSISKALENPDYSPRKPTKRECHLLRLMTIFQMTYVGAPMIYYGDEVGMWGGNDPDCRKPMLWEDLAYEDEVTNPDQSRRPADVVEVDRELFRHLQKMIAIRKAHPALQTGSYRTILADTIADVFAFERRKGADRVFVVLNNQEDQQRLLLPDLPPGRYIDLVSGLTFGSDGQGLPITIPAKWGCVLVRKP